MHRCFRVHPAVRFQLKSAVKSSKRQYHSVPRHFVAIPFPNEVIGAITELQHKLNPRLMSSRVRWTQPHNLHLTLKFFGSALGKEQDMANANHVLSEVAKNCPEFDIELKGIGVFPKWKKPRVLFISIADGTGPLKNLESRLNQEWAKLKVPVPPGQEFKLRPHVTIGRWSEIIVNEGAEGNIQETAGHYVIPIAKFRVTTLTMFHSSLEESSPVYTPIHSVTLKEKPILRTK